jgi:hypothetical protein
MSPPVFGTSFAHCESGSLAAAKFAGHVDVDQD